MTVQSKVLPREVDGYHKELTDEVQSVDQWNIHCQKIPLWIDLDQLTASKKELINEIVTRGNSCNPTESVMDG